MSALKFTKTSRSLRWAKLLPVANFIHQQHGATGKRGKSAGENVSARSKCGQNPSGRDADWGGCGREQVGE